MVWLALSFGVVAILLFLLDRLRRRSWKTFSEEQSKIKTMIENGTLPKLSDEEQVLFIMGEGKNSIFRKLCVKAIDGPNVDKLITLSKKSFRNHLKEKKYIELLFLKDQRDGLWIKNIERAFETVEQERGQIVLTKTHDSLDSMVEYIAERLFQNVPKFRSPSYPIRD